MMSLSSKPTSVFRLFKNIFFKNNKRNEKYINKHKPNSIQELSNITGRKKQAVDRDIKILERYELISLKKIGRTKVPIPEKKLLIIGLEGLSNSAGNQLISVNN